MSGSELKLDKQSDEKKETHKKGMDSLYLRSTDPGAHLTLHAIINSCKAFILIDSGAIGIFMHPKFVETCKAITHLKDNPREVRVIDGRVIDSGLITHQAQVELFIGNHHEMLLAEINNTGHYDCILGMPWLVRHDPIICWSQRQVILASSFCEKHCFNDQFHEPGSLDWNVTDSHSDHDKGKRDDLGSQGLQPVGPLFSINRFQELQDTGQSIDTHNSELGKALDSNDTGCLPVVISDAAFQLSATDADLYLLEVSECTAEVSNSIPPEYSDLKGAFSETASNELPNHSIADMKIELKDGQEP